MPNRKYDYYLEKPKEKTKEATQEFPLGIYTFIFVVIVYTFIFVVIVLFFNFLLPHMFTTRGNEYTTFPMRPLEVYPIDSVVIGIEHESITGCIRIDASERVLTNVCNETIITSIRVMNR